MIKTQTIGILCLQNLKEVKYMLSKFVIKHGDKAVYLIGAFIVLVFAVIMIVMFANTGEKTPATSQKVWDELVTLGYEPADTT